MIGWLRRVLAALLGAGLVLAWAGASQPAQAQASAAIESLRIELWPEFDKPAVLVLMTGTLAPGTALPAQVTIRIPAVAGQPHATAYSGPDGQLLTAPSTSRAEGADLLVTLTVEAPNFRLEYYDPGLTFDGDARRYQFLWKTDDAIRATTIRVQEPFGAHNITLDPAFTPAGPGEFGLNYQSRDWGPLAAGATVALTLQYAKSSAALSSEAVSAPTQRVSVDNSAPAAATTPGGWSPWLIGVGIAAVVTIAGGVVWYLWRRRSSADQGHRLRRGKRRSGPGESHGSTTAAVLAASRYCTQCGQSIQVGDRFCRNCGAQIND